MGRCFARDIEYISTDCMVRRSSGVRHLEVYASVWLVG